jgi:diacylglycerol kinase
MYRNREFKHRNFMDSFNNSRKGLSYIIRHERNARRMIALAIGALILAAILRISITELAIVMLTIGMVICCEIVNTLVEYLADLFRHKYDNRIKVLKDMASAAPLFASIIALIIAGLIFLPKIFINAQG